MGNAAMEEIDVLQNAGMKEPEKDGYRGIFCRGGSMRPLFHPGDRVNLAPCVVQNTRPGDVIVFNAPGESTRIVHRVVAISAAGVRTRGDANDRDDRWQLSLDEIIGRVLSVERKGKVIPVAGGLVGCLLGASIHAFRKADHLASYILHPCYRNLARSGIFRALLPSSCRPRVISIVRDGQQEMHLVMGRRVIGRRPAGGAGWTIRRPFRIFVDESSLP
jgi:signal peptidase I